MEDWKNILSKALGTVENVNSEDDAVEVVEELKENQIQKEAVHVFIEKKGRNGKTATIIEGFLCDDDELKEIAKSLKTKIGVGGSVRGGEILLQGDWKERAKALLKEMGFKVKG